MLSMLRWHTPKHIKIYIILSKSQIILCWNWQPDCIIHAQIQRTRIAQHEKEKWSRKIGISQYEDVLQRDSSQDSAAGQKIEKLTDGMGLRWAKSTISIYAEQFFTKLPKQFNEKSREDEHGCRVQRDSNSHQPRKKGRREEGRREIGGRKRKGKKNKRREKKKVSTFTLNH